MTTKKTTVAQNKTKSANFDLRGKLFYQYCAAIAKHETAQAKLHLRELAVNIESAKPEHAPLIQKQDELRNAILHLRDTEMSLLSLQKHIAKKFDLSNVKDLEKYEINEHTDHMSFVSLNE